VGHVLRFSGLLHVEASQVMLSYSGLKTDGGAAWMVHVTLLQRLRRYQVENGWVDVTGCVRPCYPYFIIFIVLEHISSLVLSLLSEPINRIVEG
jgi:hypothetical protein